MIHEFTKLVEVETPLGRGKAIFMQSTDHDYFWTVILDDSCAIVTFRQHQLKAVRNYSLGWGMTDDDMKKVLNESQSVRKNTRSR